jgi:hypothetical protein
VGEGLSSLGVDAKYISVTFESGQGYQAAFSPTNVNTLLFGRGTGNAPTDYKC